MNKDKQREFKIQEIEKYDEKIETENKKSIFYTTAAGITLAAAIYAFNREHSDVVQMLEMANLVINGFCISKLADALGRKMIYESKKENIESKQIIDEELEELGNKYKSI